MPPNRWKIAQPRSKRHGTVAADLNRDLRCRLSSLPKLAGAFRAASISATTSSIDCSWSDTASSSPEALVPLDEGGVGQSREVTHQHPHHAGRRTLRRAPDRAWPGRTQAWPLTRLLRLRFFRPFAFKTCLSRWLVSGRRFIGAGAQLARGAMRPAKSGTSSLTISVGMCRQLLPRLGDDRLEMVDGERLQQ